MKWDERLTAALKPGRWYARHYTYLDVARSLNMPKNEAFYSAIVRAEKAGIIVIEPWGPLGKTLRLPGYPLCESSRRYLETLNYSTFHNSPRGSWPTITEAEQELGLKRSGLSAWLSNRDLLVVCPRGRKYRLVSPWVLAYYIQQTHRRGVERVEVRPRGYVAKTWAVDFLGTSDSVLYKAVASGKIKAVRRGYVNYYSKSDLERFALELKETPLPGYEALVARCQPLGADVIACRDWLTKRGYRVRKFRTPYKQLALHASSGDLDAWQASRREAS